MDEFWEGWAQSKECSCGVTLCFVETYAHWAFSEIDLQLYRNGKRAAHDVIFYDMDRFGCVDENTVFGACQGDNAGRVLNNDTVLYLTPEGKALVEAAH